jgi:putative N-acetylmannosamine-6-phosphate epimerase
MTVDQLVEMLANAPLIASVQASPNSPVQHADTLARLAQASLQQGVRVLRLQGRDEIQIIREACGNPPTIGLIKREYDGSAVYITPTQLEVMALIETGCEIIALDATDRARPGGAHLKELVALIHQHGRLAMGDCDSLTSAKFAVECGIDLVGTTLSGYTNESAPTLSGPDLDLLRSLVSELRVPIIAEGRYALPSEAQAALAIGATAVVVGGALNDPVKQTRVFVAAIEHARAKCLAVDIGGTWIRAATFSGLKMSSEPTRIALPPTSAERIAWIREQAERAGMARIAISTGGVVDPRTLEVTEAKAIIPDHVGTRFRDQLSGFDITALNDGLATAWGHACHPEYAGKRVATLALGTGVGCGLVDRGRIVAGKGGDYPRLNDLPTPDGRSFEDLLGGAALTSNPSQQQQADAILAGRIAADMIQKLFHPDAIVLCGGVGLSPWLDLGLPRSPFGADAGLYGAAALLAFPPVL